MISDEERAGLRRSAEILREAAGQIEQEATAANR
jgi:hypothetical protein